MQILILILTTGFPVIPQPLHTWEEQAFILSFLRSQDFLATTSGPDLVCSIFLSLLIHSLDSCSSTGHDVGDAYSVLLEKRIHHSACHIRHKHHWGSTYKRWETWINFSPLWLWDPRGGPEAKILQNLEKNTFAQPSGRLTWRTENLSVNRQHGLLLLHFWNRSLCPLPHFRYF